MFCPRYGTVVDSSVRVILLVTIWMGQREVYGWEVAEDAATTGEWEDGERIGETLVVE
jgi:hypothetical protein